MWLLLPAMHVARTWWSGMLTSSVGSDMQELSESGYVTDVYAFSKMLHGVATLLPDSLQAVPYWVDDESVRASMAASGPSPPRSIEGCVLTPLSLLQKFMSVCSCHLLLVVYLHESQLEEVVQLQVPLKGSECMICAHRRRE